MTRHLVMNSIATSPHGASVMVGCDQRRQHIPYDRSHHTYLTRLATCHACLAVAEAVHIAFVADLGLGGESP